MHYFVSIYTLVQSRDAIDQLKLAKYNLEANKQEFDEYKQKAQRILQVQAIWLIYIREMDYKIASLRFTYMYTFNFCFAVFI